MTADKYPGAVRDDDPAFNPNVAHQARVYNYLLGGKDHYDADREYAEKVESISPGMGAIARENRVFLGRAMRFLAGEAGLSQFLDIGTGIPGPGSTHEVAQEVRPDSRVVYVDFDPVVLAHARAFLVAHDPGSTDYIDADLRDPGRILEKTRETLDFTQPVGLLLVSILHAVDDQDDPHQLVATLMDALPSGSYLAISHWGKDPAQEYEQEKIGDLARSASRQQYTARSEEDVARLFAGLDLAEPGIVPIQGWRPDPEHQPEGDLSWIMLGGVARKP